MVASVCHNASQSILKKADFKFSWRQEEIVFCLLSFVTLFNVFSHCTVFVIQRGTHKIFMRLFNKLRNAIDIVMLIQLILNCVWMQMAPDFVSKYCKGSVYLKTVKINPKHKRELNATWCSIQFILMLKMDWCCGELFR